MKARIFKSRLTFPPMGYIEIAGNSKLKEGDEIFVPRVRNWLYYDTVSGWDGRVAQSVSGEYYRFARKIKT